MGSINVKLIRKKVKNVRAFESAIAKIAKDVFEDLRTKAINEFLDHPITQELKGGAGSSNSSQTLGGIGNLFTFIGFNENTRPIEPVEALLKKLFYIRRLGGTRTSRGVVVQFRVFHPELADFDSVSQMPWGGGSWVKGVENGISGFGFYMLKRTNASRSGGAIQIDHKIRSASFKRMDYITEIVNNFRKNF